MFRKVADRFAQDGVITHKERSKLQALARALEIDPARADRIEADAKAARYQQSVSDALADGTVTEEEARLLNRLQVQLDIKESAWTPGNFVPRTAPGGFQVNALNRGTEDVGPPPLRVAPDRAAPPAIPLDPPDRAPEPLSQQPVARTGQANPVDRGAAPPLSKGQTREVTRGPAQATRSLCRSRRLPNGDRRPASSPFDPSTCPNSRRRRQPHRRASRCPSTFPKGMLRPASPRFHRPRAEHLPQQGDVPTNHATPVDRGAGLRFPQGGTREVARAGSATMRWHGKGEKVAAGPFVLCDPLVYLSHGRPRDTEASCIDLTLPVERPTVEPRGSLGYYPQYAAISPGQRANYIRWLASGRTASLDDIGYAFLYFYGLERRLLVEQEDLSPIVKEVVRLLETYTFSGSFDGYLSRFLSYTLARAGIGTLKDKWFEAVFDRTVRTRDEQHLSVGLGWLFEPGIAPPRDLGLADCAARPQGDHGRRSRPAPRPVPGAVREAIPRAVWGWDVAQGLQARPGGHLPTRKPLIAGSYESLRCDQAGPHPPCDGHSEPVQAAHRHVDELHRGPEASQPGHGEGG